MRAVVLVPRRRDDGPRDQVWARVRDTLWAPLDFELFEGHHDEGPFCRAAAVNAAGRDAGDWDVAVVADADVLVEPAAIHQAIDLASKTGRLVFAHDTWRALDPESTQAALSTDLFAVARMAHTTGRAAVVSGVMAVPRSLWDRTGGLDEGFKAYGYEDHAFVLASRLVAGEPIWVHGDLWHLWHPPHRGVTADPRRIWAYRAARTIRDLEALWASRS